MLQLAQIRKMMLQDDYSRRKKKKKKKTQLKADKPGSTQ
jgi:hypothetical protein